MADLWYDYQQVNGKTSQHAIKNNAKLFIKRFANATSESGDAHTFWDDFFKIFGLHRMDIVEYEWNLKKLDSENNKQPNRIDVFWPKVLLVEHKSAGKDLDKADEQAMKYYNRLDPMIRPKYVISCDFVWFHFQKIDDDKKHVFRLVDLVENLSFFEFMRDEVEGGDSKIEEEVSKKAAELIDEIYKRLEKEKYDEELISKFLTRIAYCMFAEDAGIFENKLFYNYINKRTMKDGTDLCSKLNDIFYVLNKPKADRKSNIPKELDKFPHINGKLFKEDLDKIYCNEKMRDAVLKAAKSDWSYVSPSIFGSLFEGILNKDTRRGSGSHYTSSENVSKVINPLFLDDLWSEYYKIRNGKYTEKVRINRFKEFQEKLASLTFFDPACGSGSFLVIAYRELRRLEFKVIKRIQREKVIQDSTILSKVNVNQFYGIELEPFPAHITQTALWMVDHLENMKLSYRYDGNHIRIPLTTKSRIYEGDALEVDWNKVIPNTKCDYILGNPPFKGAREMDDKIIKQMQAITKLKKTGMLDYVTAWFIKASDYATKNTRIGLVATNSITQGIQLQSFWNIISKKKKMKIIFAYQPFKWESDTKGKAQVTVVILGLSKKTTEKKQLFIKEGDHFVGKIISEIPPSLKLEHSSVIIERVSRPLNGLPKTIKGNATTDNGNYTFTDKEKNNFVANEPKSIQYFRPLIDAKGFLRNKKGWILMAFEIPSGELQKMPLVKKRVAKVKEYRKNSPKETTRKRAEEPRNFERPIIPTEEYLVIPVVSSEKRMYLPIEFHKPPTIASASTIILKNPTMAIFGLLSSRMHMIWTKRAAGRLETRVRYSNLVYNTFPVPKDYETIKAYAQKIIDARNDGHGSTLADLYDSIGMPKELRKAHENLDKKLESLYPGGPFKTDEERLRCLEELYEKMKKSDCCG